MDPDILKQKDAFPAALIEKLGTHRIDYADQLAYIHSSQSTAMPQSAAGVLLLLHFSETGHTVSKRHGEYCFHLIKRSARVSQPGDLSCPGGMLSPRLDVWLRALLAGGLIPAFTGKAKNYARQRPDAELDAILLFLTGAVREAWEEIRLSPFNIRFLGPLPCHTLVLFRRTIFPLVGLVKRPPRYRPNDEVEKIVEIPLRSFFHEENYARLQVRAVDEIQRTDRNSWEFPCFIHQNAPGDQEVLWGATFNIILKLLEILFDFTLPDIRSRPVVSKTLGLTYLTGSKS
jgi:8-oxo-dGTP pyrophosphatase MutT (NUDIX family)